jgi:hypothetical protein
MIMMCKECRLRTERKVWLSGSDKMMIGKGVVIHGVNRSI